jgi:hypothetical protein
MGVDAEEGVACHGWMVARVGRAVLASK